MPRRNRRAQRPDAPRPTATTTSISAPRGWTAQRIKSRDAGPDYVCPRCHRAVVRASEHVVAWPAEEDRRRHWHPACWDAGVREGLEPYRWG